ncbi:MAG: CCA tRNA nucleotidyltransferase [Deltaproteobacteria bacterium]|nr:MAG: CCA tRNA nucleotidyltransferase [Deltaproteobacteria bacterium]
MSLKLPQQILRLARDVDRAGGRIYLVGGSVRDHLLGRPVKDFDLEVFSLPAPALEQILGEHGRVNPVGRAFGVYKLACGRRELDISLPRRDNKVGPGHRGIAVEGDPDMSLEEAVTRRDLTVNAIMLDVNTGQIHDPAGGQQDLERGWLRAVDVSTFLEDPLRAVRVAQFAARLCFEIDPALEALCAEAELHELPAERIQMEWTKLLLRGLEPSRGLRFLRRAGLLPIIFPRLNDQPALDEAVDRAVHLAPRDIEGRRLGVPLLAWLAESDEPGVVDTLDRLAFHRWKTYPLRDRVVQAYRELGSRPQTDADLRHLSTRTELTLWLGTQRALSRVPAARLEAWQDRIESLGIADTAPSPLLRGRDLITLGVRPGPQLGACLDAVYQRQLDGAISTYTEAIDEARAWLLSQA